LAVGLIVSAVVAQTSTGMFQNAAACGSGRGYGNDPNKSGYGYAPGCPPAGKAFGEGGVFVVEPGQKLTLHGTAGVPNANGNVVQDNGGSTHESSVRSSSTPQTTVVGTFVTDNNGNFVVTITVPPMTRSGVT